MNNQKQIDLRFGFKSENDIHEYLETYFGKLLRTEENINMGKYYEFDKYNEDVFIEMKTRRINHNQYSGRTDRGTDERDDLVHIATEDLKPLAPFVFRHN